MTKIPVQQTTLDLVDLELKKKFNKQPQRTYLGMSQLGDPCWRRLYYSFRHAAYRVFMAKSIRSIQDGFEQEKIMSERLRMISGVELITDVDCKQIGFEVCSGHLRGHVDGMIRGIIEAPQSWHVWEHKAVNETKFSKLINLIKEDKDTAFEKWDEIYYCQAQLYMYCSEVDRHYLTVSTPGGRDYVSLRTKVNKKYAENMIEKAMVIIFETLIPAKLSDNHEFYLCKWCEHQGICHYGDLPEKNCRTCEKNSAIENGKFSCCDELDACKDYKVNEQLVDRTKPVTKIQEKFIGEIVNDSKKAWDTRFK